MKLIKDYPKKLVANRNKIEGAFVFALWKNPELYDDYELNTDNELLTEDGKFYYSLGKKMYDKNLTVFDDVSILSFLDTSEELLSLFNKKGGCRTVNEMKSIVASENVDSYHDEILKSNAVIELYDEGYFFRDEKELDKVISEMTYADLEDYLEYKINNIFLKSTSNGINVGDLTSKYESYIKEWNKGTGFGIPLGFNKLNYTLAGLHTSNLILHLAGIGQGKSLILDEKLLTPNGYIRMGDVQIGDKVYGEDGKIHNVVGIFPQGEKDIYKVTFNDGTSVECCDEHLWNVRTAKDKLKNKDYKTMSLKEIIEDGYYYEVGKDNHKIHNKFIPLTKPLKFDYKEVLIDAYELGLLLGDGGFSDNSVTITYNSKEVDLIQNSKNYYESLGMNFKVHEDRGSAITYRISRKEISGNNKIKDKLIKLGLFGTKSNSKFVPKEYLYNNESIRLSILQGLIDSDGEVNNSNYTFSSVSEQLIDDVKFLVQSLGGTARKAVRQTYYTYKGEKKKGQISFRLHIKLPNSVKGFRSKKHEAKFKIGQREAFRCITNIEYIGKKESQCISVDNPSKLYLTTDMIVTHNTTSAILTYVLPALEVGEHVLIIANEQNEEQFAQMMLATVLFNKIGKLKGKLNRQKLLFGNFSEDELEDLHRASEYLKKYKGYLHYVHLTEYGTTNVKRIIKRYAKLGVKTVLFDTLKPYDESSDKAWAEFSETAKELFTLAQKEDIAIVATAQLSSEASKRKFLDLSCIGKSRAIAETASTVVMFRRLQKEEREKLYVYDYVKGTSTTKQIPLDREKDYVVYFIPKNRYGGTEKQIVYERNMSFNTMKEIGYTEIDFDGFISK